MQAKPSAHTEADRRSCPECGTPLPRNAPMGHCPKCLIGVGLAPLPDLQPPVIAEGTAPIMRLGEYELLEQIGRGGMGVVYRARKPSLNKVFALKMLLHADTATPQQRERLHIEAETAATIRHPNIVPVFDFGESEGRHFIAMELIEGRSLAQKIAAQEFQMPHSRDAKARTQARERLLEIARLMATVAHAVEHAHQCRFLHRDIKPSNILLDEKGKPYLTDFGLAKALDVTKSISESGTVLGTINYMSPEQAEGKRVGVAADVFSLGAVLYELLTGQPPFRGESISETLRRLQETDPEHPRLRCPWIDTDLATICLKCLEKDPHQRYVTAGDLAEDLNKWLANEPVKARPVRFFGRLQRWCRREPKLAAMAAGLFLLVSAVALLASALLWREKEIRIAAEQVSSRRRSVLIDRIERSRSHGLPVHVSAEEMAEITAEASPNEGPQSRFILAGRLPERGSDRVVPAYGMFAHGLQTSLWHRARFGAMFDVRLYPSEADTQASLLKHEANLAQLEPARYVLGRRMLPGLIPIAGELHAGDARLHGAIVTHPESGITNLAGVKGRWFAFGDPDSALGWYLPRAALAAAGLRAGDLMATNLPFSQSIGAVRRQEVQAGVVKRDDLERLRLAGEPLLVLTNFDCPGFAWVATSGMESNAVAALQDALLSLRDRMTLMRLDSDLTGFGPIQPSDYDDLERVMEAAKAFDAP